MNLDMLLKNMTCSYTPDQRFYDSGADQAGQYGDMRREQQYSLYEEHTGCQHRVVFLHRRPGAGRRRQVALVGDIKDT